MNKTIRMNRVRRWVWLPGRPRFRVAAGIACAAMLAIACESGIDTPVAPSATGAAIPTAISAATVSGGEVVAMRSAPLSFAMDEIGGSGYSGSCTLGDGGSGFRVRAVGQGIPNTLIRFVLRETSTGYRHTDYVDVDPRGVFRTHQNRITYFLTGDVVDCLLIGDDGTTLAGSVAFAIP